jgi:hypothetical protein
MDEALIEDIVDMEKYLIEALEALQDKNRKLAEQKIKEARALIEEIKKRYDLGKGNVEELKELSKKRLTEYDEH